MTTLVFETQAQMDEAKQVLDLVVPDESITMEVKFRSKEDDVFVLPEGLSVTVLEILRVLASGNTVTIGAMPEVLSTTEAARVLGVSRPTLMKHVREGRIPSFMVGTHTRLHRKEVLAFRDRREEKQMQALDELRELEFELDTSSGKLMG